MGFLDIINQREAEDNLEARQQQELYRKEIQDAALANIIWQDAEARARAVAQPVAPVPQGPAPFIDPRLQVEVPRMQDINVQSEQIAPSLPTGPVAPGPVPGGPTGMGFQPSIDPYAGRLDQVPMASILSPASVVQGNVEIPRPQANPSAAPSMPPLHERGTIDPYAGRLDQVPMTQTMEPPQPAFKATPRGPAFGPPPTAEEFQARVSGWESLKQKLARPEILGPLQTFLTAVSAPLGPGESMGSRMGRASMLAQVHQKMLQENDRTAEYSLRMQRAELATKEDTVAGRRLDNRGKELGNTKAEKGMATELAKEEAELETARLKNASYPQEVRDKSRLNQAHADYYDRMPREPSTLKGQKDPSLMTPQEAKAEIEALADTFIGTGANKVPGADFIDWLKASQGNEGAQRFNQVAKVLGQAGYRIMWRRNGDVSVSQDWENGVPAQQSPGLLGDGKAVPFKRPTIPTDAADKIPR